MEVNSLTRSVQAADLPMEKLVGSSKISEKDKISEVSRQFEAVLLRHILQSAQKTHFAPPPGGNSAMNGIYQDMVTNQLADSISKSGAFGLAKTLNQQLQHELPAKAQKTS
jgi:Rod binding domain-containing protein